MNNIKLKLFGVLGVLAFFAQIMLWSQIVGSVNVEDYHVKQAAVSGKMTVINTPGVYGKWFGDITKYKKSGMFNFSEENLDGGNTEESQPLSATFMVTQLPRYQVYVNIFCHNLDICKNICDIYRTML